MARGCGEVLARQTGGQPDLADAGGHRRQAALHGRRPRRASSTPTRCPGFAPFVRGPQPTMYAGRPWTIRQYAGFSTAEESNAFYRAQPRRRRPGRVGRLRPRHAPRLRLRPPARRRRRRQGRRRDRLGRGHEDPVRRHPARQDVGVDDDERRRAAGARRLHRRRRGAGRARRTQLAGTIQNDILKEFMVRNTYIYPPAPSMRIVADIIEYTAQHMPKFNSISISGYHMQEAGRDAGARARVHARRRPRVRARGARARHGRRRLRRPAVVLLRHRHELLPGDRQAARGAPAVVADHDRRFGAEEPEVADAAHALPDVGLVADRAGPVQQRRAHRRSRRWPRCSAARSRCTPTRSTRRSRCRPTSRRASRATRS